MHNIVPAKVLMTTAHTPAYLTLLHLASTGSVPACLCVALLSVVALACTVTSIRLCLPLWTSGRHLEAYSGPATSL